MGRTRGKSGVNASGVGGARRPEAVGVEGGGTDELRVRGLSPPEA